MTRARRCLKPALFVMAVAVLVAVLPAAAEVGVFVRSDRVDADGDVIGSPYVQSIIDLPDPISIWHRHSPIGDVRYVVLNPNGGDNGDGPPDYVFDSGRDSTLVVWSRNMSSGGEGYKVVASEFIDGAWDSPRRVNGADGQQFDPQVTIAPDGTTYIVYWQIQGAEHSVWLQTIGNSPDRPVSAPERVSQPGVASCRPSVVVHEGTVLIAYEKHPGGVGTAPKEVVVTEWQTNAWVEEVVAVSNHAEPLWPRIHSSGDQAWIDWVDFTTAPYEGEMAWTEKTDGGWTPVAFEPFTTQAELEYSIRESIAQNAAGPYGGGTAQQVDQGQTP